MKEDFPLEAECCICGKYKLCTFFDADLNGPVCHEDYFHVIRANEMIIEDLIKCGILQ